MPMHFGHITAAVCSVVVGVSFSAQAAPYGGAPMREIAVQTSSMAGYRATSVVVLDETTGARIHGAYCRTSPVSQAGPGPIRIERLDRSGKVEALAFATLSRALTGRESGCAFFDLQTAWRLGQDETLSVSASTRRNHEPL